MARSTSELHGAVHRQTLSDVIITVRYTARTGGSAFAETVKSAIGGKPRDAAWLLNLASDFPDRWQAFMNKPSDGMTFSVERHRLPGASGNVTGVYLHYELVDDPLYDLSREAVTLNGIPLKPGAFKTVSDTVLPLIDQGQEPPPTWKLTPSAQRGRQVQRS